MKQILLFLSALIIVNVAAAQYDPKALEVLEAMSKKYKAITSFEAILSAALTNESAGVKDEFKGKITVKGNKYVLALPEQEVYNNGKTVWTYLPEQKEVNIDDFDPKSDDLNPSKIFEMYKKGFKYLLLGQQTEGGVPCDEVDLVPEKKDAQYFKIKMLISKKDRSVQSWTMFDRGGNRYKYTITKFTPNVKVDDSFFDFDLKKHPGVSPNDLR
ncbi:MAG: outer membrane lipoprotein carrier protein LolA [Bacteroidetes bacterium]|nr:outer membrane lipoprotein carrier protein LolA [Bacteroidota bacterium]MBS1540452.1 outer membrane lipoprotein carrier protein LolA [Bacteroidota bacterium]